MLALMSATRPPFLEIDSERLKSAVSISSDEPIDRTKEWLIADEHDAAGPSKTLQLLRVRGFPRLLPEGTQTCRIGILALVSYCRCLRELSLSYCLLSDELLLALSTEQQIRLETLRVEAHPEAKPLPRISETAWIAFATRLPDLNLVLLSYMIDEDEQMQLFTSHVPVTHLYFGEAPSEEMLSRIGDRCPKLVELVISAYGPGAVDQGLIAAARGCPRLSAVGLGDCELTCSSLVEFVALCARRLRTLYVWETSLVEDDEYDVPNACEKISALLGRTWAPEYIPMW